MICAKKLRIPSAALMVMMIFGQSCVSPSQARPRPPQPARTAEPTATPDTGSGIPQPIPGGGGTVVSFARDVLPIFNSAAPGAVYRCTTCHASYAQHADVAVASIADLIITSVDVGGNMPANGDKLSPQAITLIKQWRIGGMQP